MSRLDSPSAGPLGPGDRADPSSSASTAGDRRDPSSIAAAGHGDTRAAVRALAFGNFAIGTGVMVVVGMLDAIAQGLGISVPGAGQLVTISALVTCVGAPLMAAFTTRVDRRRLLIASLLLSTLGHAFSALASGFASLAVIRAVTMLQAAVFTPQAAATISLMVPPAARGRAVTGIFIGWSVASVVGMPLGNLVAVHLGWRASFVAVALLSAMACCGVMRTIPRNIESPGLSVEAWRAVARNPLLTGVLAVTLLGAAGQFTLSAYAAPALTLVTGSSAGAVAALMGLFGAFGLLGNVWVLRHVGRQGPDRSVALSLTAIVIGLGCAMSVTLAALWAPAAVGPLLLGTCGFWGFGCFAMNSAQQARLAATAP
ncbi:MAG: MFS transporter, partial [Gammaproteobacteria bacterium]